MKTKFYEAIVRDAEAEITTHKKKITQITWLRTVTFFGGVFAFAGGYDGMNILYFAAIACFFAFTSLVKRHDAEKAAIEACVQRKGVAGRYLERMQGTWKTFPVTGEEYLTDAQPQYVDLGVFGASSIFQYICCAHSAGGRRALAESFRTMPPDFNALKEKQEAVCELFGSEEKRRFAVDFEALRMEKEGEEALENADCNVKRPNGMLRLFSYLLPLVLLLLIVLAALGRIPWVFAGFAVLINTALSALCAKQNERVFCRFAEAAEPLEGYREAIKRIEGEQFSSAHLRSLQERLKAADGTRAFEAISTFAKLADWAKMRGNFMMNLLGSVFLLFDFHLAARCVQWQEKYAASVPQYLAVCYEMEALISLATIGATRNRITMPELLAENAPHIVAEDVKSLLIAENTATPNRADFTARTAIITGSNMSGKTTFMRALASSAVLAYAGAPVCAKRFALTPLAIFTSIRVNDNLAEGISTFYAEILRIKSMTEYAKKGAPMLICIDEIFKGTNSADRVYGAEAAIEKLTAEHAITLVTTHDFELCSMARTEGVPIENYHFEESYENGKIKFDYKLKEGRAKTTNARYLLQMAGIADA